MFKILSESEEKLFIGPRSKNEGLIVDEYEKNPTAQFVPVLFGTLEV